MRQERTLRELRAVIGDVSWSTPGQTSADSLPLGNGNIAANVWTEPNGDIGLYLAKNDAWDSLGRLIKVGRLQLRLDPPLQTTGKFEQHLSLADASIVITDGDVAVRLWIDAHWPRLVIEITSATPRALAASLHRWRETARPLSEKVPHAALGLDGGPLPLVAAADHPLPDPDALPWHQRNESSIWAFTLQQQGLGELVPKSSDPLLHRTFGALLAGDGMRRADDWSLRSESPQARRTLTATVHCAQTPSAEEWLGQLRAGAAATPPLADAWRDHSHWWTEFWDRSYIRVEALAPDWDGAATISRQSAWQRYLVACCSRGLFPLKFNGGLFTADWLVRDGPVQNEPSDADYRRWGGGYWWQNTRLPYWAAFASGDYDLLRPLFRMYRDALALAEHRTKAWFGHDGAFFPETLYFWGTYLPSNYGWDRAGKAVSEVENRYIGRLYVGGLELTAMMLETYAHTRDTALLESELLPIARAVLAFYAQHYSAGSDGRLRLAPAQALETWWETENPLPDVAGLHDVIPRLLALPSPALAPAEVEAWRRLRDRLPPVPTAISDGQAHLLPAEKHEAVPNNMENAELYAVFPFKLFGVGRPGLDVGRWTFAQRKFPDTGGWRQDALHAALLGLGETAAYYVTKNFTDAGTAGARFRGFWGPNYDWAPDFDHGSVTQLALQAMLVQEVGARILLFPAWPADRWNVAFKLHVSGQTTIEAELKRGELVRLTVTPAARRRDVVVLLGRDKTKLT